MGVFEDGYFGSTQTHLIESTDDDEDNEFQDDDGFERMPTEEEMREAKRKYIEKDSLNYNRFSSFENQSSKIHDGDDRPEEIYQSLQPNQRQTFLYSATAISGSKVDFGRNKKKRKLKDIPENIRDLPSHLQE
jgi:hypothetical protein